MTAADTLDYLRAECSARSIPTPGGAVSQRDAAGIAGLSVSTLTRWRAERGPDALPWIVRGGHIFYRLQDLARFLDGEIGG